MKMRAAWLWLPLIALSFGLACGDDAEDEEDLDPEERKPEVRELLLDEPPAESDRPSLFEGPRPTTAEVLDAIGRVRKDVWAKALFLRIGPMGGAWGRSADIADALRAVRRAGKPVHCHFDLADNAAYALLAQGCDRISMTPAGDLDLVGVAAHVFYARSLLDRIGITAELLQVGRYKGAADTFTRDDMPPETRESMGLLLDDLSGSLERAIADGRRMSRPRVRELIDAGPYDADGARRAGLVDDVGFEDEAREHARRAGHAERVREIDLGQEPEPLGLAGLLRALSGDPPEEQELGDRLALVYLDGTITDGEDEDVSGVQSGPFVEALREIAHDDEIKAVVLRIDSPGGSALASDRMWHALRAVTRRKPVIVSIGDMAASGGYYVAVGATEIWAHETSLVGSIGVVGGKINGADLAENIGVNVEVIERGRHSAWTSPARPFRDDERAILQRMLQTTYRRFVSRVAEGRRRTPEQLAPAVEGRLMSGRRAKALGLVDRIGTLRQAIHHARQQGHLRHDAPIEVWPPKKTFLDNLAAAMGGSSGRRRRRTATETALGDLLETLGPIGRATGILPLLLTRERTAVALPFVLEIR